MWKWTVDISRYQALTDRDWQTLVDNGCAGVIMKSSQNTTKDAMLERHLEKVHKFGFPYNFYHWVDPIFPIAPQVNFFWSLIDKFNPVTAWQDDEQYWRVWAEFWDVWFKRSTHMSKFHDSDLYRAYYTFDELLSRLIREHRPGMNRGIYSAGWFVNGYCPSLARVINTDEVNYWNAASRNYFDPQGDRVLQWKDFHVWLERLTPIPSDQPRGVTKMNMWQVCEAPFENMPELDLNVISEENHARLFGIAQTPEPKPEPPPIVIDTPGVLQYRVTVDVLNIRSSPKVLKTNDIGDLPQGTIVPVHEIAGQEAWIQIAPGQYACVEKNGQRFMEKVDEPINSQPDVSTLAPEPAEPQTPGADL